MPAPYARIACFIDRDPASEVTLAEALSLRAGSPGELHVVHVAVPPWAPYAGAYGVTVPISDLDLEGESKRWLDERVADIPGAIARVIGGWAPRSACEYAHLYDIDLIVGAAHRGFVKRAMLGGFASYVSYHAPCPVLLVHPPAAADDED